MMRVQSWGGVGDTLRNLMLIPHAVIHRWTGQPLAVRYLSPDLARCRADALPPDARTMQNLVSRCPSLSWDGTGPVSRADKMATRMLREFLRLSRGGKTPLFRCEFRLSAAEEVGLPPRTNGVLRIGLQTHLRGMRSKIWPLERWREVVEGLLAIRPDLEILLIEPAPEAESLVTSPRVIPAGGYDIAQAIRLVENLDYLISVDSWSKYPAAAACVPQLIIVPDQTADYPQLTPASLLRHEFDPLHFRPEVSLLGLQRREGVPIYSFGKMENLSVVMVLDAVRAGLQTN